MFSSYFSTSMNLSRLCFYILKPPVRIGKVDVDVILMHLFSPFITLSSEKKSRIYLHFQPQSQKISVNIKLNHLKAKRRLQEITEIIHLFFDHFHPTLFPLA